MIDLEQLEDLHNCNIIDASSITGEDVIFILDNSWDIIGETNKLNLEEFLNENP